jgi:hypothetical protein
MPRLRNRATGVVVDVPEDKAGRLGSREWEPVDGPVKAKVKSAAKRLAAVAGSDDDDE